MPLTSWLTSINNYVRQNNLKIVRLVIYKPYPGHNTYNFQKFFKKQRRIFLIPKMIYVKLGKWMIGPSDNGATTTFLVLQKLVKDTIWNQRVRDTHTPQVFLTRAKVSCDGFLLVPLPKYSHWCHYKWPLHS